MRIDVPVTKARRSAAEKAVIDEMAAIQRVVSDGVHSALQRTGESLNVIRSRGYDFYIVHDLLIGAPPRRAAPPEDSDERLPMLYRACFYGELTPDGQVRLHPTARPRIVAGDVAREFVSNRLSGLRFVAPPCSFCGHPTITFWQRLLARYGRTTVRCRACLRPYSLDVASVKQFVAPVTYFTVSACLWLAGHLDSLAPIAIAAGAIVVAQIAIVVLAPQRLR